MYNFWNKQRLVSKLSAMILITIIISISTLYLITRQTNSDSVIQSESSHLLNIAQRVSKQATVIDALLKEESVAPLRDYVHSLERDFNLDYIVIITLESIRLTHPDESLIYEKFIGGDESLVFEGKQYVSTGVGSLGTSLRAFVPVYSNDTLVGAIVAGMTNQSLAALNHKSNQQISLALILSIIVGISFATLAAFSIKRQLFNMEPEEIAQRFEERNAMFEYTHDSVIVTDQFDQITLSNSEAARHFQIPTSPQKVYLSNVLPNLDQVLATDPIDQFDKVYRYKEKDYIFSYAPILVDSKLVGKIYIIRDATEIYTLLDQLYSTSQYAQSLQVQSHEFLNKLHVIYGLVDLENYAELKVYLDDLINKETELTQRISVMIHNPVIAGQLIGENRRLIQALTEVSFNVLSEIPANNQSQTNQLWIDTVKTIHDEVIEHHSNLKLNFEIDYKPSKLITHYYFEGEILPLSRWIRTREWGVPVELEVISDRLHFVVFISYEESKNEI